MDSKIKVVVRKRPLTRREVERGDTDILETLDDNRVILLEPKVRVDLTRYVEEHSFTFDDAFSASDSNADVYTQCIRPLVDVAVDRHCHATCFAYGCTGSGKTYTMMGDWRDDGSGVKGLYALAATDLFAKIARGGQQSTGVAVSFYEIYMGKLYDLLNERSLVHARENGKQKVVIAGLTEQRVATAAELLQTVGQGLLVRRSGSTSANCDSSRSHAVLQILLKNVEQEKEGRSAPVLSRLTFVDLAGAERAEENLGTDRQSRMDGAEINKSLLALKECIRAMDQDKDHTPFRGSKLTQVLKESFVGDNCRTVMIANLSPASSASEHCLNTLRYADRVKELRSKPEGGDDSQVLRALGAKECFIPPPRASAPQRRKSLPERPAWVGVLEEEEEESQPPSAPALEPTAKGADSEAGKGGSFDGAPLSVLAREHDKLIGQILAEEEELISAHRGHVDAMVELMKEEYDLVNDVDQPGSMVEDYVDGLDRVLDIQLTSVQELVERARTFYNHLAQEDALSKQFNARWHEEGGGSVAAH